MPPLAPYAAGPRHRARRASALLAVALLGTTPSLLIAGCTPEPPTGPVPTGSMTAIQRRFDAVAYATAILDVLQASALYQDQVDWAQVRSGALADVQRGETPEEVRAILAPVLDRVGGRATGVEDGTGPPAAVALGVSVSAGVAVVAPVSEPGGRSTDSPRSSPSGALRADPASLAHLGESVACGWVLDLRGLALADPIATFQTLLPLYPQHTARVQLRGPSQRGAELVSGTPGWTRTQPLAVLHDRGTTLGAEGVLVSLRGLPDVRSFGLPSAGLSVHRARAPLPGDDELLVVDAVYVDREGAAYPAGVFPDEQVSGPDEAMPAALAWLRARC